MGSEHGRNAPSATSPSEREQVLEAFYDSISGILFLHDQGNLGHTSVLGEVRHSTQRCEEQLAEVSHAVPGALGVSFTVHGVAKPAGSKTPGRTRDGRLFVRDSSKGSAPWKRQVAQAAGEAMDGRDLLEGALWLGVVISLPRPQGHYGARGLRPSAPEHPTVRPDLTKLLRGIEDALTGVVWRDDAQVVEQHVCKVYGGGAECAVKVRTL